jgi:hypothetical protein
MRMGLWWCWAAFNFNVTLPIIQVFVLPTCPTLSESSPTSCRPHVLVKPSLAWQWKWLLIDLTVFILKIRWKIKEGLHHCGWNKKPEYNQSRLFNFYRCHARISRSRDGKSNNLFQTCFWPPVNLFHITFLILEISWKLHQTKSAHYTLK